MLIPERLRERTLPMAAIPAPSSARGADGDLDNAVSLPASAGMSREILPRQHLKSLLLVVSLVTSSMFLAAPAQANYDLGLSVGTTGYGLQFQNRYSRYFGMRLGVVSAPHGNLVIEFHDYPGSGSSSYGANRYFTYNDYDENQSSTAGMATLDIYPARGRFRMSLGAGYYRSKIQLRAQAVAPYTYAVGHGTYTADQVGRLDGRLEYNNPSAYIGVGWDFMAAKKNGFGAMLDIGYVHYGAPDKASLLSTGSVTSADLATEANVLKGVASTGYPMIGVTAYYRF